MSERYQYLYKLYIDTGMHQINMHDVYVFKCNSLQQYKNFNYEKRLLNYLKEENAYDACLEVKNLLEKYEQLINGAPQYITKNIFINNIEKFEFKNAKYEKFHNMEIEMCNFLEIHKNDYAFDYKIQYVSPTGRNSYSNGMRYTIDEIVNYYDLIQKETNEKKRKRTVSASQRQRILRRDKFTCQLCGVKGVGAGGIAELHVDHKIPFSKGGSDDDSNLWVLCRDCNLGKSNKYED